LLGAPGLRLPGDGELRQEVVPRGRRLVEPLVAAEAVPAGPRLGDQYVRPLGLRELAERAHQVAGREDPRVADLALRIVRPALGDLLAQQVDDPVAATEGVKRRLLGL